MSYLPTSSPGSGLFYEWLVSTQIEPAFRKHPWLKAALVLGVPSWWRLDEQGKPTTRIQLMIVYSQDDQVRLSELVSAYTEGTQDPNLPDGVRNHDLFEPVDFIGSSGRGIPMPLAMCPERYFVEDRDSADPEYGVLDGFFVYAAFSRDADDVRCTHRDEAMSERLDRFLNQVIDGAG